MSMNGYQVDPSTLSENSKAWEEASSTLSGMSGSAGNMTLDEMQLSFASRFGMADAYKAVVERFARLTSEGAEETRRLAEAINASEQDYISTDTDSAGNLGSAGGGLSGGYAGGGASGGGGGGW